MLRRFDIRKREHAIALVAVLLLVIGSAIGVTALAGGSGKPVALPPTPKSPNSSAGAVAGTVPGGASSAHSKNKRKKPAFVCPKTKTSGGTDAPQEICIPSLRVATNVTSLGLNPDHTVEVPPLSKVGEAGWYRYSAAPGTVGPTVILGHVDSAQYGEGVFFRLSSLRPGDQVRLQRGDGKVAIFRINNVTEVSKQHFPTASVYGATSGPAIRLVTCGGAFDASTGNYLDNIIAYGTLLHLRGL